MQEKVDNRLMFFSLMAMLGSVLAIYFFRQASGLFAIFLILAGLSGVVGIRAFIRKSPTSRGNRDILWLVISSLSIMICVAYAAGMIFIFIPLSFAV